MISTRLITIQSILISFLTLSFSENLNQDKAIVISDLVTRDDAEIPDEIPSLERDDIVVVDLDSPIQNESSESGRYSDYHLSRSLEDEEISETSSECAVVPISKEFALTKASCNFDTGKKFWTKSGHYLAPRAVYNHPRWNKADNSNDLSLIRLRREVDEDPDGIPSEVDSKHLPWIWEIVCSHTNAESKEPDFCAKDVMNEVMIMSAVPQSVTNKRLCVEPRGEIDWKTMFHLQICDPENDRQVYTVDKFGQIHSKLRPDLCLRKMGKSNMMLHGCWEVPNKSNAFLYDRLTSTVRLAKEEKVRILAIKNNKDPIVGATMSIKPKLIKMLKNGSQLFDVVKRAYLLEDGASVM